MNEVIAWLYLNVNKVMNEVMKEVMNVVVFERERGIEPGNERGCI